MVLNQTQSTEMNKLDHPGEGGGQINYEGQRALRGLRRGS